MKSCLFEMHARYIFNLVRPLRIKRLNVSNHRIRLIDHWICKFSNVKDFKTLRSLDLTHMDCLWSCVKAQVYSTESTSLVDLKQRIILGFCIINLLCSNLSGTQYCHAFSCALLLIKYIVLNIYVFNIYILIRLYLWVL